MKQTLHLIALRTIRHNDRHNIFTAYSLERGRMAFAVSAGAGRNAARMRALMMPLSLIECEAELKPGVEVGRLANPRALATLHSVASNPVKNSLALFLAEVLGAVLRDGPGDESVWRFIAHGIMQLDALPPARLANFHLCFLAGLARVLGVAPDITDYREAMVFDLVDARFRMTAPLHTRHLAASEARAVVTLMRLTYANMHRWRMDRATRARVLEGVLEYYTLHHTQLTSLRSLDVLHALM